MFAASLLALFYLIYMYTGSASAVSVAASGATHLLYYRGACVYLTDIETTGLSLLRLSSLIGVLIPIAIVPKQIVLPPDGTPRWLTLTSARFKTGYELFGRRGWLSFLSGFGLSLAAIIFTGQDVATLLVSHGVILVY
jgi:hypothetical protein